MILRVGKIETAQLKQGALHTDCPGSMQNVHYIWTTKAHLGPAHGPFFQKLFVALGRKLNKNCRARVRI